MVTKARALGPKASLLGMRAHEATGGVVDVGL